jgi:ribosome maturation factor RimP
MAPYRIRKVDANQAEIVAALRAAGCSVQSLAEVGHGVPDLLVARAGQNWLLEVKSPGGKLTADEAKWLEAWRGKTAIVYSIEDALKAVGL